MFEVTTIDGARGRRCRAPVTPGLPHLAATPRTSAAAQRAGRTLAALARGPRGHSGVAVVVLTEATHRDRRCRHVALSILWSGHAMLTGLAITCGRALALAATDLCGTYCRWETDRDCVAGSGGGWFAHGARRHGAARIRR